MVLKHITKRRYQLGLVECRFIEFPVMSNPLIMAIPGGPAISSLYIDNFIEYLSKQAKINIGIIELPRLTRDQKISKYSFSYNNCCDLICEIIEKLRKKTSKLIILGHSLGARLAFDAYASLPHLIDTVIALNLSVEFKPSNKFIECTKKLDINPKGLKFDSEKEYAFFWEKILPLYFYKRQIKLKDRKVLMNRLTWLGRENIISSATTFESTIKKIKHQKLPQKFAFVEGKYDDIVPNNNAERLKKLFPNSVIDFIPRSGHFPMLENPNKTAEVILKALRLLDKFYVK